MKEKLTQVTGSINKLDKVQSEMSVGNLENTSQFKKIRSKIATPCGRLYKPGWMQLNILHQAALLETNILTTLSIRDFIVYELLRYPYACINNLGILP